MPNLKALEAHRNEILWWEICALLHDIGKLSDEFLYYRQNWHLWPDGYSKRDPHEHWFDTVPDALLNEFSDLRRFFGEPLANQTSSLTGVISIRHAVLDHTNPKDELMELLKRADSSDSAYDRNNPLFGCEQTCHADPAARPELFRSNTFGYESEQTRVYMGEFNSADGIDKPPRRVSDGILTRARRELYQELERLLPLICGEPVLTRPLYREIRDILRKYFAPAMSDTTRPNNDTDLWEHTYSVASITKALHIQRLQEWEPRDGPACFRLWGFGFDALRYLSYGHKIGDILGRRAVLDEIFDRAEDLFEYEIPFGNCVYRDDGALFFLVPAGSEEWDESLRERIINLAVSTSKGEIVPAFAASGAVRSLTHIVREIQDLRVATRTPVTAGAAQLRRAFAENWQGQPKREICSVCRTRPTRDAAENHRTVCRPCLERRRGHFKIAAPDEPATQTPFVEEIADKHGRLALVVAKLGLHDWLNGVLVRTNLVRQADAVRKTLEAMSHTKEESLQEDFQARGSLANTRPNTYGQMLDELAQLRRVENPEALFLYGRAIVWDTNKKQLVLNTDCRRAAADWNSLLQEARAEHDFLGCDDQTLLSLLCGKTPTPSTVLDVWTTAETFFRSVTETTKGFGQSSAEPVLKDLPPLLGENENGLLPAQPRAYIELECLPNGLSPHDRETFLAEIAGHRCEVVYEGNNSSRFWILDTEHREEDGSGRQPHKPACEGQSIKLLRDDGGGGRDFSEAPDAKIAKAGTKERAYFPFRLISHSPQLLLLLVPASAALDVSTDIYKSYLEQFGKAYGRLPLYLGSIFFQAHLPMFAVLDAARRMEVGFGGMEQGRWVRMQLPLSPETRDLALGTEEDDWHHPYLLTPHPLPDKPSFFQTCAGPVARIQDIGDDDEVLIRPNLFDWEFLGASAHRFRLHSASSPCPTHLPPAETCVSWPEFQRDARRGDTTPLLLEDALLAERPGSIAHLWQTLRDSGIAEASLRNLEQLLVRCRESWRDVSEKEQTFDAVARSLVSKYFDKPDQQDAILNAIQSGLFFRALDLYLRILKEPLKKGDKNGTDSPNE